MNKKQEIAVGALSGGNSDNGGNAGPRYLNSNNSASNTDVNIGAAHVNFQCCYSPSDKENISISRHWRAGSHNGEDSLPGIYKQKNYEPD